MKILSNGLVYPIATILLFACGAVPHHTDTTAVTNVVNSLTKTWMNPKNFTDHVSINGTDGQDPQVAMSDTGFDIITWAQYDPNGGVYKIYKSEYHSGVWSNPTSLADHISPDETFSSFASHPGSPTSLSVAPHDAVHPQVTMDDNNQAIITWFQSDGVNNQIFKSEYRNGAWSNPNSVTDNISPDGQFSYSPQVAMDNNNNAIITWFQFDGAHYRIFKSEYHGGVWTNPTSLADNISIGTDAQSPQVSMNIHGDAIITWYQFDGSFYQIYKSEYHNGVWSNPTSLTDNLSPAGQDSQLPQVAMNDAGDIVVAWLQFDGSKFQVFKSEKRAGVWTNPTGVSDNISPDGQSAQHPQLAMDSSGNAVIVWYQSDGSNDQVFKSEYRGGAWSNPTSLSNNISPNGQYARLPQVAMDDNGNAVITWYEVDGNFEQIFKSEYREGIWTNPTSLSDNVSLDGQSASLPQVALNNHDNAIIVWQQFDGNTTQIFKSEYR